MKPLNPKRKPLIRQKKETKIGLSPGSLVYVGSAREEKTAIHCTRYNESKVETFKIDSVKHLKNHVKPDMVNWINITGIHNIDVMEQVGHLFAIHPLIIEDILNTEHRPNLEIYEDFLFVSLKAVYPTEENLSSPQIQQISFVLGENYLLSFQETDSDYFQTIRQRIDREGSRLRSLKTDYLMISLIDFVVDHYLSLVEHIGDEIQNLEDLIFDKPEKKHLSMVMANKKNLLYLWRIIQPAQESLFTIRGMHTTLIDPKNKIYIEDVYDHLSSVKESLDLFIELNSSMRESYSFSIGLKTNEVMKLLTIISTLFIPLTFLVGVYGMNFINIPELYWTNGYFYLWGIMILITGSLIIYFKKRKWF